jgi:translation initiation factor RLI1
VDVLAADSIEVSEMKKPNKAGVEIELRDAIFDWTLGIENQKNDFRLAIEHLVVMRGEFVCVVGRVGCGKTSLVHALINEMPMVRLSIIVRRCAQVSPRFSVTRNIRHAAARARHGLLWTAPLVSSNHPVPYRR